MILIYLFIYYINFIYFNLKKILFERHGSKTCISGLNFSLRIADVNYKGKVTVFPVLCKLKITVLE